MVPSSSKHHVSVGLLVGGAVVVNIALVNWFILAKARNSVDENRVKEIIGQRVDLLDVCNKDCVITEIDKKIALSASKENTQNLEQVREAVVDTNCDEVCVKKIIRQEVPGLIEKLTTTNPTTNPTSGVVKTPLVITKSSSISIPDGAIRFGSSWTQIPSTSMIFDTRLYGEISKATWQGWVDTGGPVELNIRLYDTTNHRVVDGSTVYVNGVGKVSFYSDNMSVWRGQNGYVVEVKGVGEGNVTITAMQFKFSYK